MKFKVWDVVFNYVHYFLLNAEVYKESQTFRQVWPSLYQFGQVLYKYGYLGRLTYPAHARGGC